MSIDSHQLIDTFEKLVRTHLIPFITDKADHPPTLANDKEILFPTGEFIPAPYEALQDDWTNLLFAFESGLERLRLDENTSKSVQARVSMTKSLFNDLLNSVAQQDQDAVDRIKGIPSVANWLNGPLLQIKTMVDWHVGVDGGV